MGGEFELECGALDSVSSGLVDFLKEVGLRESAFSGSGKVNRLNLTHI